MHLCIDALMHLFTENEILKTRKKFNLQYMLLSRLKAEVIDFFVQNVQLRVKKLYPGMKKIVSGNEKNKTGGNFLFINK